MLKGFINLDYKRGRAVLYIKKHFQVFRRKKCLISNCTGLYLIVPTLVDVSQIGSYSKGKVRVLRSFFWLCFLAKNYVIKIRRSSFFNNAMYIFYFIDIEKREGEGDGREREKDKGERGRRIREREGEG